MKPPRVRESAVSFECKVRQFSLNQCLSAALILKSLALPLPRHHSVASNRPIFSLRIRAGLTLRHNTFVHPRSNPPRTHPPLCSQPGRTHGRRCSAPGTLTTRREYLRPHRRRVRHREAKLEKVRRRRQKTHRGEKGER